MLLTTFWNKTWLSSFFPPKNNYVFFLGLNLRYLLVVLFANTDLYQRQEFLSAKTVVNKILEMTWHSFRRGLVFVSGIPINGK